MWDKKKDCYFYFVFIPCILFCNMRFRNFKHTIVYLNSWNKPEDDSLAQAETCRLKYK
jgi:hypothetical protein